MASLVCGDMRGDSQKIKKIFSRRGWYSGLLLFFLLCVIVISPLMSLSTLGVYGRVDASISAPLIWCFSHFLITSVVYEQGNSLK